MKICSSGSRTEEVLKNEVNDDGFVTESSRENIEESLRLIDDLKFFLATAPVNWQENQIIRRYYLNNDQGFVSCVFWNSLYYITGTDIVKCCMYRMQKFGREVIQKKKFEEGIFSDLRNLKCGVDATLEQPKSEFLSFLFRNLCLKTQKKQKVFFWFSVPHDELFADALERDLKRESMNQPSTTRAVAEPALSFTFDILSSKTLNEQLTRYLKAKSEEILGSEAVISGRMMVQEQDMKFKNEDDAKSPLKDIIQDDTSFGIHIDSSTDTQQDISSTDTSTDFEPQKLVVEPSNLELNNSDIPKDDVATIDEADRGDFPLDYFPVEIEYPHQEREFESLNMRMANAHLPPFYDNRYEEEIVPPTATFAFFPPYAMHNPFAMPLSGTRSQFLVNNNRYWTSQPQERSPSSSGEESPKDKIPEQVDLSDSLEKNNSSFSDQQHQPLYQSQAQYLNPYSKALGGGTFHGYHPQADMAVYPSDVLSYAYDDFPPSQEIYDQGYSLPPELPNWGFVPPQAMQPPASGTGFLPRPFTPSFRSTPITGRTPYLSVAQNGWPISSPHGPRSTSATTKTHSVTTMHQQQPPTSFTHRRQPYSGNIATTKNVPKQSKVVKPSHLRTNSQQRKQQVSNTKAKSAQRKTSGGSNDSASSDIGRQFSIPTPESNTLVVQVEDADSAVRPEEYLNADDLHPEFQNREESE
ncbi:hypothetical protein HG537_0E02620 [Torulaspora globosa]|uniref:STE-domain-containing protein n=1 Tax=Torulaspora globosa TaxID=48254 RepID=A0A7H9HVW9_9SACH|nr:hypothetical protein HG537_0E02620 [Torulaspora sp. CBS 2947]